MVELAWYQNNNMSSPTHKKWYVRPVYKEMLDIKDMAKHMEEHNTPFTAGTIEGILTDFVKCIREQVLNGNTVKIADLAIFKISIKSNVFDNIGGIGEDGKVGAMAAFGQSKASMRPAVKTAKLLAEATGDFMRSNLNPGVKFGWSTEAQAEMEEAKKAAAKPDLPKP